MDHSIQTSRSISTLLVEDSPDDALLVREMLAYECGEAIHTSHVERLSDARRVLGDLSFDCLLLDLSLPDADELEALSELRPLASDTPIVILSGQEDERLATQAVRRGAQDYLVKGRFDSHALGRAIHYAIERKLSELALARWAMHDTLTGLPNRILFLDRMKQALARTRRHRSPFALMFLDLDGFKLVNDRFGHAVGDQLLVTVAERLRQELRESDTPARFGGDEFMILCEHITYGRHSGRVAERILRTLADPFVLDGKPVFITASIGVVAVSSPTPDTAIPELIHMADMAMYGSKECRNTYRLSHYPEAARSSK